MTNGGVGDPAEVLLVRNCVFSEIVMDSPMFSVNFQLMIFDKCEFVGNKGTC